jgi:hypothetical protein
MKAFVSVKKNTDLEGKQYSEDITLNAVYSEDPNHENKKWSHWTPAMHLTATINNPDAFGALDGVKEVFIDISPAEEPAAAPAPTADQSTATA